MGWVRYWPGTPLLGLVRASISAELAHRRLADYHWATGQWVTKAPAEGAALVRVAEADWAQVVTELQGLGWRWRKGQLIHPEVAETRLEAVRAIQLAHTTGRKGAERRWGRRGKLPVADGQLPMGESPAEPDRVPTGTPIGTPSPTPIGTPIGPPLGAPVGSPIATPLGTPMQIDKDKENDKDKDKKYIDKAFNAERLTLSVSAHEKSLGAEKDFLGDVKAALEAWGPERAEAELTNWGGWWRKRFRESPDKARRVLAEIRSMVREGRILSNPGAAAMDLWKRLP